MREDHTVEGALLVKSQQARNYKNHPTKAIQIITIKEKVERKVTHLVNIVAKWVSLHSDAGKDLMLNATSAIKWDMKQSYARAKINKRKKLRLLIRRRRRTNYL